MDKNYKYYKAIDWNSIEDEIDKSTWEKLTEQFWLDTRVPLSNDLDDWRKLSPAEKDLIGKVFGGLTLLDTMQSESGVQAIRNDCRTQHEEAVLNNIQFMEAIHAKSYSSIFSTLNTKKEIEDIFEWTNNNEYLQKKAKIINEIYERGSALEKKVASVFLESFLFYSGFFTPLYYLGNNKMANVAEIIKLIIRDESVHGTYIGYKFQLGFNELPEEEQTKLSIAQLRKLKTLSEVGWGAIRRTDENLEELAQMGLLTSEESPLDKKINLYKLTKEGNELAKALFNAAK